MLTPFTEVFIHILSFGCPGSPLLLGLSLVAVSGVYPVGVVCGLLVAVTSLGADQGLQAHRIQ